MKLIHDGKQALFICLNAGKTSTQHTVFTGTLRECKAEIERLGLSYDDHIAKQLSKKISVFEFRSRFTDDELTAFNQAAKTDETVDLLKTKLLTRSDIDLLDSNINNAVHYLTSINVITKERLSEILK